MLTGYSYSVAERFLRYVRIDTQSDPNSTNFPSTEKQRNLSRLLVEELKAMGIPNASLDEHGYVYAEVPSNTEKKVPAICFCAHVDTSPDCSGEHVNPLIHHQFDGNDICLPDDPAQVISVKDHPYLREKIGDDIITASGTTLLGADDKAGVAVIMGMAQYFISNPDIKHGSLKLLFTPDEEIGRGVDKLDLAKLGADFGYTLDGGELGSLEDETFSADGMVFTFNGVSAHPGYARGKLVNAIKVAAFFINSLPKDELAPEATEDRFGFVHPVEISGTAEKAFVKFIIRDFFTGKLAAYEDYLNDKAGDAVKRFPGSSFISKVNEQYRNMKEVLDQHPQIIEYALEAIRRAGLNPKKSSARGGTDGSRLSHMGLPCPNIFTGEMAFHCKHEYVSVQDMQKSVATIIELSRIWEEKS
jgi:tripeptide aminopeptidase